MNKKLFQILAVTSLLASCLPSAGLAQAANLPVPKATTVGENITGLPFKDAAKITTSLREVVRKAVDLHLMGGYADGGFHPESQLTREELAAVLARTLNLAKASSSKSSFADVPASSWSAVVISQAVQAGILKGEGNKFYPHRTLTREEAAVILVRASGVVLIEQSSSSGLPQDWSKVAEWAKPYVRTALAHGFMTSSNNVFAPKSGVQRQYLASMLIDTFFPENRLADLQKLGQNNVLLNGNRFNMSPSVAGILTADNQKVLEGAKLSFASSGRTITSVKNLQLTSGGALPAEGQPEFSGNQVFDGHGATLYGNLEVLSDFITIRNVTIQGDLIISAKLQHDFLASGVKVLGTTKVLGGDSNTVVFENSSLAGMDINKPDVHVATFGTTTVDQITVLSNASISADAQISLPKVTVASGAQNVQLSGNIGTVEVTAKQPVTLTGSATIDKMDVQTSSPVRLDGTGTVQTLSVSNSAAQITVSSSATVANTSLAAGVPAGAVVTPASPGGSAAIGSGVAPTPSPPVNTPPRVVTPIDNFNLNMGQDKNLDLSGVFADSEQTNLDITAASSIAASLKAVVSGNQLTLSPLVYTNKVITIGLTAKDSSGAKVSTTFKVTLNRVPVAGTAPASPTIKLDDGEQAVDISSWFTDEDNDSLSFLTSVADTTIVSAKVEGGRLLLTPAKAGTTRVTLTADDGRGGTVEASLDVTVTANAAPVTSGLADQALQENGSPVVTDLSAFFTDPEGDAISYSAVSADPAVADVDLNGSSLTVTPKGHGSTVVTVTATDARGAANPVNFNVSVNASPLVNTGQSNELTVQEQGTPGTFDLSLLFTDPDGDMLNYTAESGDLAKAAVAVNGHTLTVTPNSYGTVKVTVTAKDGKGGVTQTDVNVQVNAAPKPSGGKLADKTLYLNGASSVIDLFAVYPDVDGDPVVYTSTTTDVTVATAELAGGQLTLTPVGEGSTTVKISATDNRGGSSEAEFTVTVSNKPNHQPEVVAAISDQLLTPGITTDRTFDLSQLFSDPDGDPLTFTAVSSSAVGADASVSGSMLTVKPGTGAASATVTISASDASGATATYDLKVRTAPLVSKGLVVIHTKQGVTGNLTYSLKTLFPNQTSFKVYEGTASMTFSGPVPLGGTNWVGSASGPALYTWVVGADGSAAVIQIVADPQGESDLYFSEYLDNGPNRAALQMYFNGRPGVDQLQDYELDQVQYVTKTGTWKTTPIPINKVYANMPYIIIEQTFYDFMDIAPVTYFNQDIGIYGFESIYHDQAYNTVAFVLKKNGQIIDVLGDPGSKEQFMGTGGSIVRKTGIHSGSQTYSLPGEWDLLPADSFWILGHHTP